MIEIKSTTPPYVSTLYLKNYKGFKNDTDIKLAPLTFIVGPNNSGKSSLFSALLLLSQSRLIINRFPPVIPEWNGTLIDLGSYKDTVYKHNSNLNIEIGLEAPLYDYRGNIVTGPRKKFIYTQYTIKNTKDDPFGRVTEILIRDKHSNEQIALRYDGSTVTLEMFGSTKKILLKQIKEYLESRPSFASVLIREIRSSMDKQGNKLKGFLSAWERIISYIGGPGFRPLYQSQRVSSGRGAPHRWYPKSVSHKQFMFNYFEPTLFNSVEPTIFEKNEIPYLSIFRDLYPGIKIDKGIDDVLKELDISNKIYAKDLSAYHTEIKAVDSLTGIESNIIDMGYGASQIIPVIKACLMPISSLLFIEQPEIHLHPRAQGIIADLIGITSKHRQVFVETHSEHLINHARILVAKGILRAEDVVINYVARDKAGSKIINIPILPNGEFGKKWPQGFFDERYNDTVKLLDLQS